MKTFRELINLVETAQPMTHNNYILQLDQQAGAELYAGQDILVNGKDANDFVENFARLLINACAEQVDDYYVDLYDRTAAEQIKQHFGL